jgi:hypothetical protein
VTGAFDGHQACFCRNHFEGLLEFGDGAEGVARAVDEERGGAQVGKMLRALLRRSTGRMQGVRQKKKTGHETWFFGAEHAGLASAIGMAGEEQLPIRSAPKKITTLRRAQGRLSPKIGEKWGTRLWKLPNHFRFQRCHGIFQPGAVSGCIAGTGRTEGTSLAKRQIAAQDRETRLEKSFCDRT